MGRWGVSLRERMGMRSPCKPKNVSFPLLLEITLTQKSILGGLLTTIHGGSLTTLIFKSKVSLIAFYLFLSRIVFLLKFFLQLCLWHAFSGLQSWVIWKSLMELSSKIISFVTKNILTFYVALLHPPGLLTASPSPEP